ncbi:hypothetical protein AWJ14_16595 [Hoeflea olei]|uniref:EF-hand domain-containing protein n=1 Tax=Hoeflea olei TaxID=1480615 RepID=A0A1C1YSQ9_9HYPH|nr:hypothetical protein AWJ14_16595 [Hoeflea olei]
MTAGLSALAILALATGAFAQQGMGLGRNAQNSPFNAIDTDGNGLVSKSEVAAWSDAVFAAMDADSNGSLTIQEYMAVRMGPGGNGQGGNLARQEERQSAKASRFMAMDLNRDSKVTHEEFTGFAAAQFDRADTGKTGQITRQQWFAVH